MKVKIVVELESREEPIHVTVDGRDIRKLEANDGIAYMSPEASKSFTNLSKLAFYALKRRGEFSGSFADFDGDCVVIDLEEDDEEKETDAYPPALGGGS